MQESHGLNVSFLKQELSSTVCLYSLQHNGPTIQIGISSLGATIVHIIILIGVGCADGGQCMAINVWSFVKVHSVCLMYLEHKEKSY